MQTTEKNTARLKLKYSSPQYEPYEDQLRPGEENIIFPERPITETGTKGLRDKRSQGQHV